MNPMNIGRLCIGKMLAKILSAPFTMPEDPIPATARPTISIFDEVATPQMREPSSKSEKKPRKVHF